MLGIIINPKSGKKAYRQQRLYLFKMLKKRHQPFTYRITKYMGHAVELARELVENHYDELLVLGGDGTFSEVVNGVMSSNLTDKSKIRLGLMPRGTGNDWGRYWGLTRDYKRSLDIFFHDSEPKAIDVGCLTYYRNGEAHRQYFINSVGFGIDARTVQKTHTMKYYVGSHSILYFVSLLAALFTHKSVPMRIRIDDGEEIHEPLFTMNIGNGPYSGGGIKQNPDADPCDGIFQGMFVPRLTMKLICQAIPKLFNGRITEVELIKYFNAKQVRLLTSQYTVFEADGILVDACGPYTVDLLPSALQMVVPKQKA